MALLQYGENQSQVPFSDVWRVLIGLICITALFTACLRLVLPPAKSQVLSLVVILLFFLYDPAVTWLHRGRPGSGLSGNAIVEIGSLIILGAAFLSLLILKRDFAGFSKFLNCACSALLLMQIWSVAKSEAGGSPSANVSNSTDTWIEGCKLPSVYYLIFDAYGRADFLRTAYHIDNEPFLSELKNSGFFIADRARSNYIQTLLSLSSTLNMDYLQNLTSDIQKREKNRSFLRNMIKTSQVPQLFKRAGHRITFIGTGFSGTRLENADSAPRPSLDLNEFENFMLDISPIPALLKRYGGKTVREFQFDMHRQRVLFGLEAIQSASKEPGSKFTFAHILSPHPPFVFGEHGEAKDHTGHFSFHDASHYLKRIPSTPTQYVTEYAQQLSFLNTKISEAVNTIIANDPDAVIILQGDHGPGAHLVWDSLQKSAPQERLAILNAYRVPDDLRSELYPGISPVNTFRLLFRHFCKAPLDKVEDLSYFSLWRKPFTFLPIPDESAAK